MVGLRGTRPGDGREGRRRGGRGAEVPPALGRYRGAAVLGVTAALGASALILRRTGASLADVTTSLPAWAHAAALAAIALHIAGRTLRLVLFARAAGARLRPGSAAAALLAADAAASITPSRVGSDPTKLYMLGRAGHPVGTGAAFIAGEMIAEAIVLTIVCATVATASSAFRLPALGALAYSAVVLGTTCTLLYAGGRMHGRDRPGWAARLRVSERAWRGFRNSAVTFHRRTARLASMRPLLLGGIMLASLAHMAGRLAVLPILGHAIAPAAPLALLVAWPLLFLYAGALLPPPAGGGAIEVAFAATVGDGVPAATLASLLLWWRFYTFYLPALAGGLLASTVIARARRAARAAPEIA
jgi:glycosyltransferase 2 family protein